MTRHTVGRIGSGEYSCSCGAVWDYADGPECPAQSSESPAQLGNRVRAEAQEAIECQARGEQVREGWQLVPVEPTAEMLAATIVGGKMENRADLRPMIYRAMLAAAPSAGSQGQGE